ncbi:MAG: hypothetical protein KBA51_03325 [Kiritimatiellae bacterium]|nr:hypothetical protein [Kiritimatiellia bacterium]
MKTHARMLVLWIIALAMGARAEVASSGGGVAWREGEQRLVNPRMEAVFETDGATVRWTRIEDRVNRRSVEWPSPNLFRIFIGQPGAAPRVVASSDMKLVGIPRRVAVKGDPRGVRRSSRLDGEQLEAIFSGGGVRVRWRASLRPGALALRQELALITDGPAPAPIQKIEMFNVRLAELSVQGYTDGAPLATDHLFFGVEHPMAKAALNLDAEPADAPPRAEVWWPRNFELKPGMVWQIEGALGVYAPGQLRRTFNTHIELERAHPFRQYWHYNSWYDLNIQRNDDPDPLKRMTEAQCLDVIAAFGRELKDRRGVRLDGYVWDDGWDDWNTLWQFHPGFPRGFARMDAEARAQGAGTGAWLSPWGGYGGSKNKRIEYGRRNGFETNATGFSMGGARYYENFRNVCLGMVRAYAQNYFKFDGIGGGTYATGANESIAPDLDGLMRLIAELRAARPSLFINCTVGSWASPYWLWSADSIWRQGNDVDYKGVGNAREQWITYRDHEIYTRFASRSPLFPISSLMYHGVVMGDRGPPGRMPRPDGARTDEEKIESLESFRHEVWMAAGLGSTLGELYITPRLMTPEYWDVVAEAMRWSRARASIMRDNHWIGGSPERLDVYGYAGWSTQGGVLTLRNPSDQPKTFALDIAAAFELPPAAPRAYRLVPAFPSKSNAGERMVESGRAADIPLAPFEVVVYSALPIPPESAGQSPR